MNDKISVLLAARRNSRFLSHFMFNYFTMTSDFMKTELLVLASEGDEWNKDLFRFFQHHPVRFFFEDMKVGKFGRHLLFQELLQHSTGDWILTASDDHIFVLDGWDESIRKQIRYHNLDSNKVHVIMPKHDNTGEVSHLLSRGWVNATGRIAACGAVDSWANAVCESLPSGRIMRTYDTLMHDYTVDFERGNPEKYRRGDEVNGWSLPMYGSEEVREQITIDAAKLNEAIKSE